VVIVHPDTACSKFDIGGMDGLEHSVLHHGISHASPVLLDCIAEQKLFNKV
jgi:hypothetical protein